MACLFLICFCELHYTLSYLLYRYGFTDGIEHPLIGAALHFHLSENRTKKVEGEAMDSLHGKLPWWF